METTNQFTTHTTKTVSTIQPMDKTIGLTILVKHHSRKNLEDKC